MTRICPSCGAATAPEARFCRRCGAPLRRATDAQSGPDSISPQAATIPLREEGRTTDGLGGQTDGLSPDDTLAATPETTLVSEVEMETMLRQTSRATDYDPDQTVVSRPRPSPSTDGLRGTTQPPPTQQQSEEDLLKTRANAPDFDEELTILSSRPFTGEVRPAQVQQAPTTGPLDGRSTAPVPPQQSPTGAHAQQQSPGTYAQQQPADMHAPTSAAPSSHAPAGAPPHAAATPRRRSPWVIVAVVCVVLLVVAAVVAFFAVSFLRRPRTEHATVQPTAPASPDERGLAQDKLIEAESLLAGGDLPGALERLREATRLDPANARAHRRLGDILLETGARREAIEELRRVTQLEPNDFTAWRALAAAQLAEGLPVDAAESYKRLVALTGETDANDLLAYADALRLAGRADEAGALYQRLSTSTSTDVAAAARQHLSELAAAVTAPTPGDVRDTRPNGNTSANTSTGTQTTTDTAAAPTPVAQPTASAPTPQPTPPPPAELSPSERYRRGVELWGSNRGAAVTEFLAAARAGNADANYYLGLNLVEGRDLGSLKRAEVVAALSYFQRAQSGGNGAQARRYAQQLEKEYDRIRNQKQ
jgi:tetratricopeptide (TPR) repeat protein